MAQYILHSDKFTKIEETEGTLVNISNVPAEVSESQEFGTGIILFPRQHFPFSKGIYAARAPGHIGTAVVAAIGTNVGGGGGGSSGNTDDFTFTDDDVRDVFGEGFFTDGDVDDVFTDSDFTALGLFTQEDVNDIFR